MREKYDIKNLNPRANPYAKLCQKQVTEQSEGVGMTMIRFQKIKKFAFLKVTSCTYYQKWRKPLASAMGDISHL